MHLKIPYSSQPSFFPEAFALCNNHRPVLQPTLATVASQMTKKGVSPCGWSFASAQTSPAIFDPKWDQFGGEIQGLNKGGTGAESTHAFPWPDPQAVPFHIWSRHLGLDVFVVMGLKSQSNCSIHQLHQTDMFHHVSPCFTMFPHVSPCFTIFPDVSPCFPMFPHVSPCFTMFHHVSPCFKPPGHMEDTLFSGLLLTLRHSAVWASGMTHGYRWIPMDGGARRA